MIARILTGVGRGLRILFALSVFFAAGDAFDRAGLVHEGVAVPCVILAVQWLVTLVHELGHAGGAWASGSRVIRIAVLPFAFDLTTRPMSSARRPRGSDIAGYVVVRWHPQAQVRDAAVMFASGPLAELLLAGVLFAYAHLVAATPHAHGWREWSVALAAAGTTVASGGAVINLLPIGGSDGVRLFAILRRVIARQSA
ncbi:hypothetical protein MTR62_06090 [Novosphingobium sp. 1949]|uniref:Peptidase M50 domain-containing protein n=1 Tax=Novosphingobium organovorum TaxID=2930092 RepID=A0ABT0BB29_9SPHN|nr:hypothetical protein [Novosphingobium organovorum]MCJ2182271.1 hypothetical protein [Novosphingobium organovorum]